MVKIIENEVAVLEGKNFNTPEFIKVKGYKYRAKMLIAGAAIVIVLIIILSLIIHGIASAVKGSQKDSDTDTVSDTSIVETDSDVQSQIVSSTPAESSTPVTANIDNNKKEKFNADNKLIIDTDTLDGKKAIALTFDDGPSEYTAELVSELNSRGVRATFFMVGSCIEKYPDVLPMMVLGGHPLGNHTYSHVDITTLTQSSIVDTIEQTDNAIFNACGQRSTAFRPPYGSTTAEITQTIDKTVTLWSLDTMDWKSRDTQQVKNKIVSQAKDGSIVLLHDLYRTSIDGALAAVDQLQGEGFVFVTVDELLTRYGYPISKTAHSAQFAVYETNSPHAGEYKSDMERDFNREAASSAAGTFYYDRIDETDTSYSDTDGYKVIDSPSDTDSDRLIY